MEFTIYNRDGDGLFYTKYESCVPVQHLESMASVGLIFYVDGKKMSVSSLKTMFKDIKPVRIPKYSEAPVDEESNMKMNTKSTTKTSKIVPDTKLEVDFKHVEFPITSRCVVCTTTGKIYKTQSEAAKDLGFDPAYISDCVCHDKAYKGYRFKRAVDLQ